MLAALLVVGCDRGADCPSEPHEPLPMIAAAPKVVAETDETRRYINAFPVVDYTRHEVPVAGHYFIEDAEDTIKRYIVAGREWGRHVVEACEKNVRPGSVVIEVSGRASAAMPCRFPDWLAPGAACTRSNRSGRSTASCTTICRSTASPTPCP